MLSQSGKQRSELGARAVNQPGAQRSAALIISVLGLITALIMIGALERHALALLTWALLVLVTLACFSRPRESMLAGAASAVAFDLWAIFQHLSRHVDGRAQLGFSIGLTSLTLLILPLARRALVRELNAAHEQLPMPPSGPTDGSPQDETTGAYRAAYLDRLLEEEVERGRRSKRSFTVCLVGLDDWRKMAEELGSVEAERKLRSAIASVGVSKRLLDKVVDLGNGEVLLVLAETPLGGAETVAWRLRAQFSEHVPAPVRVGIAEFPRDAVTEAGLMEEVHQALAFARTANIPVVDRSLLSAEQTASPT